MKIKSLFLICFSLITFFSFAQPANYEQFRNQAEAYFQQQEYEKSNQCYEQIIKELQGTEYESLIPTIKTFIAINHLSLGINALKEADYNTSKTYLEKAIENAKPGSKTYYSSLSWMAEWYSVQSLELHIKDNNPSIALEYCLEAERYYDLALQTERRIKQQLSRASLLDDSGRYKDAEDLLQSILLECNDVADYSPLTARALTTLGSVERKTENFMSAIQYLEAGYELCISNGDFNTAYLAASDLNTLYSTQIPDTDKASMWKQRLETLKEMLDNE